MSWVADENATTHRTIAMILKYPGSCREKPMSANNPAIRSSISSTKNFLVRNISRNGAQIGFSDQAIPMLPVTSAVSLSECPRLLNMLPTTQIAIANGIPSARYDVGTQRAGWGTFLPVLMDDLLTL